MKVVLFGDSLFGQFGKNRIMKLETAVPVADVYNCAAGGWDSNDCVKKSPFIAKLNADVIILSLGTNDASSWKLVELAVFKNNLSKIIETFAGSKIIYFLPPPSDESKQTPDRVRANHTTKQYYDTAKRICEEKGVLTINSWDIFMPMLERGEVYHIEDGTHLDEHAYDIVISEIANMLN